MKIEKGEQTPNAKVFLGLIKLFNIDISEMLREITLDFSGIYEL